MIPTGHDRSEIGLPNGQNSIYLEKIFKKNNIKTFTIISGRSEVHFTNASEYDRFCKRLIETISGIFVYYLQLVRKIIEETRKVFNDAIRKYMVYLEAFINISLRKLLNY